jgi:hypothetical protein
MKKKLFREQYQEPIGRIEPEIIGEEETFEEPKVEEKTTKRRRIKK